MNENKDKDLKKWLNSSLDNTRILRWLHQHTHLARVSATLQSINFFSGFFRNVFSYDDHLFTSIHSESLNYIM